MQALVDRHRQFVDNTLTNGKPVKFTQDGRDVAQCLNVLPTKLSDNIRRRSLDLGAQSSVGWDALSRKQCEIEPM